MGGINPNQPRNSGAPLGALFLMLTHFFINDLNHRKTPSDPEEIVYGEVVRIPGSVYKVLIRRPGQRAVPILRWDFQFLGISHVRRGHDLDTVFVEHVHDVAMQV